MRYNHSVDLSRVLNIPRLCCSSGFVASDTLFLALNNRTSNDEDKGGPIFPPIQGILTFDTPYNGLARSMFVYGAFSNYSKVSNVFSAMTALSAAGSRQLAARRAATGTAASSSGSSSDPAWKAWNLLAVRTGTVGAVAAGGVAAYVHREAILKGMRSVTSINKASVADGVESLGQGLAYINRGNVGRAFAWLSDHFTFVGSLLKPRELDRRLERLAALKGVGLHNVYCSLGENGYWSGGYFVPERTFCAIPAEDHAAYPLFSRHVMPKSEDEIQAHIGIFHPEKNDSYRDMTERCGEITVEWFLSDQDIVDDQRFRNQPMEEDVEDKAVMETLEDGKIDARATEEAEGDTTADSRPEDLPDVSPVDIAAAASLVPLPDDSNGEELMADADTASTDDEKKRTYMNYLFEVAQQAGTGVRGAWKWNMPSIPASISSVGQQISMPSVSLPSVNILSRKQPAAESPTTSEAEAKNEGEETEPGNRD